MKPNFALSLSHDGIGLLHRGRDGWHVVGDVSLNDGEFGEKLGYLRQTAASLESGGVTTKLVIPNSQILYTTADAPGPSEAERHTQIRAVLDGTTPYDIDDMAYDWCEVDGIVQVAAIARETLDEAEGFAVEHGFNPLSFVAIPVAGDFVGEPFFGVSAAADTLLEGTETVEQDDLVIHILAPAEKPAPDVDDKAETTIASGGSPDKKPADVISAELPERDAPAPKTTTPAFSTRRDSASTAPPDETLERLEQIESRLAILPKSKKGKTSKARKLGGAQRKDTSKPIAKPAIPPTPPVKKVSAPKKVADPVLPPPKVAEIPKAAQCNEEQAMTVFGARKKPAKRDKPRYLGLTLILLFAVLASVALWSSFFLGDITALWRGSDSNNALVTEVNITPTPVPDISAPDTAVSDALALLTKPDIQHTPQPPKPVAAAIYPPAEPVAAAAIDAPVAIEPELEPEPEPEPEPEQVITPPPLPEPPAPLTPKAALAAYSDTGIWQLAPTAPDLPGMDGIETLYIASIDPEIVSQDAVALPPMPLISNDYSLEAQTSPAAHNTKFVLDDRGLVIASLAGTLTPDGVFVFLGAPPSRPRARGDRVPQVIVEPDQRLASFRARARPGNLVEQNETAQLGGRTRAELAALRPNPRPVAPKLEDERDQTPTALAVTVSSPPKHRPPGFSKVVARARASAPTQTTTTAVAVPQNQTITLGTPTRVSVARLATTKSAINLRRVSLIGVYGSTSDRRALVRLPSGRYVKVQVGQRVDGGKVAAIGETELRYVKGGRTIVLKMPKT